jgi:hypothetical protein
MHDALRRTAARCRARYIGQSLRGVLWALIVQLLALAFLFANWQAAGPMEYFFGIGAGAMLINALVNVFGLRPGRFKAAREFDTAQAQTAKLLARSDLPALIAEETYLSQVALVAQHLQPAPGTGQLKSSRLLEHLQASAAYIDALRYYQLLQLAPESAILEGCDAQYAALRPLSGCLAYDAVADLARGRRLFISGCSLLPFAPWRPANQLRYLSTMAAICAYFAE